MNEELHNKIHIYSIKKVSIVYCSRLCVPVNPPMDQAYTTMSLSWKPSLCIANWITTSMALASFWGNGTPWQKDTSKKSNIHALLNITIILSPPTKPCTSKELTDFQCFTPLHWWYRPWKCICPLVKYCPTETRISTVVCWCSCFPLCCLVGLCEAQVYTVN